MNFKKIIIGVCVLLISCKESDKESGSDIFTDEKLVNNIIDLYALPQQEKLLKDAEVVKDLSKEFSKNTTEANLLVLRQKWKVLAKSWSRSFIFDVGKIKSKHYLQKLAYFPVKQERIEGFERVGGASTGIFALGYLLHTDTSLTDNIEDFKVVDAFKNSVNRKEMLVFVADKILKDAKNLNQDWSVYAKELKNNEAEEGAIENSFSILFNGLNNVIHYSWQTKVSKPSGYGRSRHISPKKLEAPYSKYSLELIKENMEYSKEIFFSTKGKCIADKIKFVTKNTVLIDKVKTQYDAVENAINAFDHSLYISLTDDFNKVKDLQKELEKLKILFSVDVTSTLSLVSTGTDGDGD